MLYGPDGGIEPPAGMVKRLQEVDSHLDMVFGGASRAWWIVWRWPENDPRRAWIKAGKRPANRDFDMWCKLPADCSADNAYSYLVGHMVAHRGDSDSIRKALDRVHVYNKQQERANVQPELDLGEELLSVGSARIKTRITPSRKDTDRKRLKDFLFDSGVLV